MPYTKAGTGKNGYTILDLKQETILSADISSSDTAKTTDVAYLGFGNGADLIIKGIVNTGRQHLLISMEKNSLQFRYR